MDADFGQRVDQERGDLLAELRGVAAKAWSLVRQHLETDVYTPFEVAKVAGIATTNVARIAAALPPNTDSDADDRPLTEAEVEQVRRMVASS